MNDDLVKRLREKAGAFDYDGRPDIACDYEQAADAIEGLLSERDEVNADSWKRAFEVERDEHRWIPVSERLPDTEDEIAVAFKNSEDGEWWYRIDNFVDGAFCYSTAFGRNITHWMPLPQPPMD